MVSTLRERFRITHRIQKSICLPATNIRIILTIKYGNRLIMMHEGHIIYDVAGEEKQKLHVSDLLAKFQIASGGEFANDRMILS